MTRRLRLLLLIVLAWFAVAHSASAAQGGQGASPPPVRQDGWPAATLASARISSARVQTKVAVFSDLALVAVITSTNYSTPARCLLPEFPVKGGGT